MSADQAKGGRIAGGALVAAAALSLGAMLHHPHGGEGASERVVQLSHFVHGVLIALMAIELYGVAAYARLRGLDRPLVLVGLTFFALGTVAMLPAPLLNGFVAPDLMLRGEQAPVETLFAVGLGFAKLASVLISTGIVLLSIGLVHERGAPFWFGLVSVVSVAPVAVMLLLGKLELDFHGMLLVIVAWSVWYAGLGVMMLRGRI
ncbi:MAG TPA: hypothetical protein VG841_06460 [Caulobacterales bacterium]|nr:hypothetical protein [Caulobacterales bacterium]